MLPGLLTLRRRSTRAKPVDYCLPGSSQSSLSSSQGNQTSSDEPSSQASLLPSLPSLSSGHEERSAKENVETNTEELASLYSPAKLRRASDMAYDKRGLSGGSGPAVPPAHTPIPEAEPEQELRIPNSELEQGLQTFKDRTYVQVLDMTPAGWEKEGLYVQIKRETTRSLPMFVKHKSVACFAYMIHKTGGTLLKRVRKGGVFVRRGEDKDDDVWIKATSHSNIHMDGYETLRIPSGERGSTMRGCEATVHALVGTGMKFKNEDGIEELLVPTMGHHNAVDHHNKDRADSGFHNLVSCTQAYNNQNRGTSRPVTLRFADGSEEVIEFMSRAHASAWTGISLRALKDAVENKTVRTWMSAVVYQGDYQDLTPLSNLNKGRKFTVSYTNVSV